MSRRDDAIAEKFDARSDAVFEIHEGVTIYFNQETGRYWAVVDGKVYREKKNQRGRLRQRISNALNRGPTIYEIRDAINDGTIEVIVASSFNGLSVHVDTLSRPPYPNRSLLGKSGRTYTNQDLIYVHDEETAAEMAAIAAESARLRKRWEELIRTLDGPFRRKDFDEYCDRYWLKKAYEERENDKDKQP